MSRKCEILEENEEGNCDTNRVIISEWTQIFRAPTTYEKIFWS